MTPGPPAELIGTNTTAHCWDAAVVGAGPAGSTTAFLLAQRGFSVLLADKAEFPRNKVCGCCLNGNAVTTLKTLGLDDVLAGNVPLREVRLASRGRSARLPLPEGAALSREALDLRLIQRAQAEGVTFWPGTSVRLSRSSGDPGYRELICKSEDSSGGETAAGSSSRAVRAKIVVAADGLAGGLLKEEPGAVTEIAPQARLGAGVVLPCGDAVPAGQILMAVGRGGYVGLVRLEDGRLDVAAALDPSAVKKAGGLGAAAVMILREAGVDPPPGLAVAPWRGTPALSRRRGNPGGVRIFSVGDATGYLEPFTGEGMAWALAAAAGVAPLLDQAVRHWEPGLLTAWSKRHRDLVGRRQWPCRCLRGLLRRPRLVALGMLIARGLPQALAPAAWFINRPTRLRT